MAYPFACVGHHRLYRACIAAWQDGDSQSFDLACRASALSPERGVACGRPQGRRWCGCSERQAQTLSLRLASAMWSSEVAPSLQAPQRPLQRARRAQRCLQPHLIRCTTCAASFGLLLRFTHAGGADARCERRAEQRQIIWRLRCRQHRRERRRSAPMRACMAERVLCSDVMTVARAAAACGAGVRRAAQACGVRRAAGGSVGST